MVSSTLTLFDTQIYSWPNVYQPLIGSPLASIISSQCSCSLSPVLSRPIQNSPSSSLLRNFLQKTENATVKFGNSNSMAGKENVSSKAGWKLPLQTAVVALAISTPLELTSEISTKVSKIKTVTLLDRELLDN